MVFRVRKPYDRYFRELETHPTVNVNEQSAGLYFLRLNKSLGVDSISMERVRHNHWIMAKKKPFYRTKELQKYSVFG